MEKHIEDKNRQAKSASEVGRRSFLKFAGVAVATSAIIMTGCAKDEPDMPNAEEVDLGSGDTGILNYAYALEQLEAAFYTQVAMNSSFTTTFNAEEQQVLKDLRDHEIVHREFLKTALAGDAIRELEFDFSKVNFSDRISVLNTAQTFEDLGVAAYNGAGRFLMSTDLLVVAGKIVSVEARHASAIRDLISPKTAAFAGDDVVTPVNGLDRALPPMQVLTAAQGFIKNKINGKNLPS